MIPSFSALFRRSRYGGVFPDGADEDDPEAQTRFKQSERFAVAAVAFCIKHIPTFRRAFIEDVLCGKASCSAVEAWTVRVEPDEWADLLLEPSDPDEPIFIVEFKIHAFLQDHQNPGKPDFLTTEGYGVVAKKHLDHRPVHYFVIDQSDSLFAWDKSQPLGIKCRHLKWAQIADAWKHRRVDAPQWESAIIEDLFESLGKIGIYAFRHMKTDKLKVTASLVDAAEAGQILTHVVEMIPVQRGRWDLATQHESPESWSFGVNVHATSGTRAELPPAHLLLRNMIQPSTRDLLWFGYENGTVDQALIRSVWFYCGNPIAAEQLQNQLFDLPQSTYLVSRDKDVQGWYSVVVRGVNSASESDSDWFLSVFHHLGVKLLR